MMKTLFITVLAIALAAAAPSPISMMSRIGPQLSRQGLGYEFGNTMLMLLIK